MSEPTTPPTPQHPEFLPPSEPVAPAAPHDHPPAPGYAVPSAPEESAGIPVAYVPENVGRGVLFSLLAIVLGAVLAALIFQLGFIASITSFAMAWAAAWLYTKGAGAPPRKGVGPLIVVIVVGVIVSLFVILGWALYTEIAAEVPGAGFGEIMPFVMQLLFDGEVWGNFAKDAAMFVLFAALGTFTTLRQLGRSATPAA